MRNEMFRVPLMKPVIPRYEQVSRYLRQMDEARIYSNFGPLVMQFEERLADRLGVRPSQVVTVSSATAGLRAAVDSVTEARSWCVPNFSFAATGFAVPRSKRLRLMDVDACNAVIDVVSCDHVGGDAPESGGVVAVLPFGAWSIPSTIRGHANVVLDAAASLGNWPDLSELPDSWSVVFSLHATKVLGVGEGGLVVAGSPELAENIRSWTTFGFRGLRISEQAGFNAKMSEVVAAYGLSALDGWAEERGEWMETFQSIRRVSESLDLKNPFESPVPVPYWNVQLDSPSMLTYVENRMVEMHIEVRKWYGTPLGQMPAFGSVECSHDVVSEWWASTLLGLPRFRDMCERDIERVHESLALALAEWRSGKHHL